MNGPRVTPSANTGSVELLLMEAALFSGLACHQLAVLAGTVLEVKASVP